MSQSSAAQYAVDRDREDSLRPQRDREDSLRASISPETATIRKALDFFARGMSGEHDADRDTWLQHGRTHVRCAREALLAIDERFVSLLRAQDGPLELTPGGEAVVDATQDGEDPLRLERVSLDSLNYRASRIHFSNWLRDNDPLELTPAGEAVVDATQDGEDPLRPAQDGEDPLRPALRPERLSHAELLAECDRACAAAAALQRELDRAREDLAVEVRQRDFYVRQHSRCVEIVQIAESLGSRMTGPCGAGLFTQLSAALDHNPQSEF